MLEYVKKILWPYVYGPYYRYKYRKTLSSRKRFEIINSIDTIHHIVATNCSVSRFGDGELQIIHHYLHEQKEEFNVNSFQKYNRDLGSRLFEVFQSSAKNHINCLPYAFIKSSVYKGYSRIFFEREWLFRSKEELQYVQNKKFYDTDFTRFYMHRIDIKDYTFYIQLLKKIWDKREVLIVEGSQTRLGINNDLLKNAKSIKRILCPPTNAFDFYQQIFDATKLYGKDKLIMLALGQTATVLAYDLSNENYQAIDIGHVDVEYEWYRMKAKKKVAINGKYVNEVAQGRTITQNNNIEYQSQILCSIK